MKKKLLALLLCVGMLAEAAIPLFANSPSDMIVESDYGETEGIAVETDSEETNTHDFLVPVEQKTEVPEGYIGIYTAEDLDNVRNDLDANYILMNDIDLSAYENWVPIGEGTDYSRSFRGKFDGNGFGILTYTQTIFSTLMGSGISNLIIECDSTYKNVDDLYKIGVLSSTSSGAIFDNVVCKGTIDIQYDNFSYPSRELMVGGIVAESTSDEFNSCSSSIVMNVYAASELNFMSLKVGGFTGETKDTEYNNSKNFGNITVSGVIMIRDNGSYSTYVGGITGYVYSSTRMSNCINYGIIESKKNFGCIIGGLIGKLGDVRSTDKFSSKISNISHCMNYGNITADSSYDTNVGYHNNRNAGGIVGNSIFSNDISHCKNRGNISGANYSGGIVGLSNKTKITNNINYGNVEYEGSYCDKQIDIASLAGIAGMAGTDEILYCSNFGSIKTVAYGDVYSGGIVGNFTNFHVETINYCFNTGEVIAKSMLVLSRIYSTFAAGIAAFAPNHISNCYNTGKITSINMSNTNFGSEYAIAGGIISVAEYSSIYSECIYNTGMISSDASNAQFVTACTGGVVGVLTGTSDMSTLTSCYTIAGIDIISHESKSPYELLMCSVLSDAEMQDVSSFVGFDFDTVWEIGVTEGYPYPTLRNNPHSGSFHPAPRLTVTPGTTTEQTQFMFDKSLCNDATSFSLEVYNVAIGAGSLIRMDATHSDVVTMPQSAGTYSAYLYAIYEDGTRVASNEVVYTVTQDESDQKPILSGFKGGLYTLALGDTLTLDGILTAAGDGKLNVVTLKHNETGTTFPPRRMELNGSTNTFNLADFGALTTDEYPLNTVGVHEFIIYASADNYTVTNNAITSFAVQVVEAVPQIISVTYDSPTIVENTDVTYTIKVLGEADKVELWVDSYNVATVSDYLTSGSYRIFTSDVSIQNPGTRVFKAIAYNGTIASEPYIMDIVVEEAALPELSSVTIMQPTNGSVLREGDSLLVKWSAPANVSSVDKYIVKVWSDVSKKYTYTNNITQNSVDIGSYYLQDVGSYSISITAIKSGYEPSESIAYFDVEEGTKVLPKPAISSPSSYGSYDAGKDLTFSWSKVSGATKYYYKVTDITDGEPGATVLSGTTDNLSVTVAGDILLAGHVICLSVYAWSSTNESEEACAYAVIVKSDVSINVSVEELDFESAADYKTIKLTSSNSWTATASESWITLDKYSGSSDSNIKLSVSKNTSDRIRWGFVEFEDSTGSVIVEVYQATSSSAYINVGTDVVRFDAKRGCSDNISITSNVSWKITSDVEWLFASRTSGTYDCEISLVVEANSNTESRTGEITISNGSISETITVIQEGGSSPTISDFMSNYTVELGHDVPLQGVIEAFGNGKLNKVTIKCNNSGGNENTVATIDLKKLNTSTFDLADFKFATTNSNIFSGTGEYTFIIYVSADNFTVTDNSIGSFTVSVTTTQKLPSVVDKGIFDIQATTVTLNAMIDSYGNGTFEKCGFDIYDANGDYIPELSGVELGRPHNNTNTFRRTVSGLTPSTKYYYCPYIKTSEGVFPPKEKRELIEFTTGEAINATDFSYCMDGYEMDFGSHLQMTTGDTLIIDIISQPHDADIKSINCVSDISGIIGSTADVVIEVYGNSFSIKATAPGSITIRIVMENYDGSTVVKIINLIIVDEEMICDVEYYDSFDENDSRNTIKGVRLSDSMFTGSLSYRHDIAKFSIALVASANHLADIETVYDAFGFSHESYNYDKPENSEEDTVAHTIASKEIYISGTAYKLVTIICRGAKYNAEWAENGKVGSGDSHEGFAKAAEDVFSNATEYIESLNSTDKSKIIVLISGFSRSAAVSNLVAQKFNNEASFEIREDKYNINNIYCYAFATPNNTTKRNSNSQNICNIINPKDIVPLVPMAGIGYGKNGYNLYLPDVSDLNNDHLNRFWIYYKNLTENRSGDEYKENFTFDKQSLTVNKLTDMLSGMCKTKEGYAIKYQKITRELLRRGFYDKNANLMELLCATYWALFTTNIDNTIKYLESVDDNLTTMDVFKNGAETLVKLYDNKQIALDCLYYIQHTQSLIAAAHRQETYISWLYALSINEMLSLKNTRTKISVKCPVDIYVYDKNGQLVGSIINNDISTGSEEIIKERTYVDGDVKMFEFLESDDYCIEIVPKATGMMSICVSDYTGNIKTTSKHYRNIPLDVEKEYRIIKAINREGEVKYQLLSSKDNIIIEDDILNEMGEEVSISTVDVGNGFSIGGGSVLAEDYVAVEAIPYVGATFIGWYLGDELVSTEPIYSFFATQSQTYTAKFTVSNTGNETDGYTVTGTVTSSDSNTASEEDDTITITLANDEHSYTATVTSSGINNIVDYRIENVVAGTYTMTVSKANHVTREYEIVVSGSDVMQDVKIHLLGDVTGDGKITAKDYSRMYAHIRKTNLLTDYALQVGDVVGADGKITAKDYSRLYAHLTKTNVLW